MIWGALAGAAFVVTMTWLLAPREIRCLHDVFGLDAETLSRCSCGRDR